MSRRKKPAKYTGGLLSTRLQKLKGVEIGAGQELKKGSGTGEVPCSDAEIEAWRERGRLETGEQKQEREREAAEAATEEEEAVKVEVEVEAGPLPGSDSIPGTSAEV